MYENGASVKTSFITTLEPGTRLRSDPELYNVIKAANDENVQATVAELPRYEYPPHLITAAMLNKYSQRQIEFSVSCKESCFTRALDAQKSAGKHIFGAGFLLSDRAAADKAAADKALADRARTIVWQLSEAERMIIEGMNV